MELNPLGKSIGITTKETTTVFRYLKIFHLKRKLTNSSRTLDVMPKLLFQTKDKYPNNTEEVTGAINVS